MSTSRLARVATLLMIALGLFSILVSVTVAAIIIGLGVVMFLVEWWMTRGRRSEPTSG